MVNNTSEHIVAAGTDSNTNFHWTDGFVEDLLKALSNFKTVIEFNPNLGGLFWRSFWGGGEGEVVKLPPPPLSKTC